MSKKVNKANTKLRSKGYRMFHSILGTILTIILVCNVVFAASIRYHAEENGHLRCCAIRALSLGDTRLTASSPTVSEYVKEHYIADENVSTEDITKTIELIELTYFLTDKLDAHFDMLNGDSDTVVQIEPAEITALVENELFAIESATDIRWKQTDSLFLEAQLTEPLSRFNRNMMSCFGSPALRDLARFHISELHIILNLVLLLLLLIHRIAVYKRSGALKRKALTSFAITLLVPYVLYCVFSIILRSTAYFTMDTTQTFAPVLIEAIDPIGIYFSYILLAAVGMLVVSFVLLTVRKRKEKAAALAAQKAEAIAEAAAPPEPQTTHCVYCKRTLKFGAKFCTYCGRTQSEDESAS